MAVFSEPPNTAVLSVCRGRRLRVSAELKRSHLSLRREAGGPLASPRSTLEVQGLTGPRDLRLNEPLGGSCARRSRSRPGSQAGLPRGPSPRRVRRPLASPLPAPASTGWAQLSTLAPLPAPSFPESLGRPRHRGRVTEGRCPLLRKYPACQLPGLLLSGGQQCSEVSTRRQRGVGLGDTRRLAEPGSPSAGGFRARQGGAGSWPWPGATRSFLAGKMQRRWSHPPATCPAGRAEPGVKGAGHRELGKQRLRLAGRSARGLKGPRRTLGRHAAAAGVPACSGL